MIPSFLLVGLLGIAGPQTQDPWATPPGAHFKPITDQVLIDAFETRAKELTESKTLAKFGEGHLVRRTKADRPDQPDWERNQCYLQKMINGDQGALKFFRAGETPLRKGFQLKVTYHMRKGPDVIRYYRFLNESYKASATNIVVYPEKEFENFKTADYLILLDDRERRFKLAGSMHLFGWE